MSTILVKCPTCATQLKIARRQESTMVSCPKCGQQIHISEIIDRIDWGTVTSSDKPTRTIQVEIN